MKSLILLIIPFVTMAQSHFAVGRSQGHAQIKSKFTNRGGIGTHPAIGWHKLTWNDFKGKQTNPAAIAVSNSGGIYKTDCLNNVCSIRAWSVFYPDSSFAVTRDSYILVHEQGHFDITEIFTRRFIKQMKSWQGCNEMKADQVPIMAERCGRMREEMQQQYDKETQCSLDHSAQERWNLFIAKELAK